MDTRRGQLPPPCPRPTTLACCADHYVAATSAGCSVGNFDAPLMMIEALLAASCNALDDRWLALCHLGITVLKGYRYQSNLVSILTKSELHQTSEDLI